MKRMKPALIVVFDDGETWARLEDCFVLEVDEFDIDGLEDSGGYPKNLAAWKRHRNLRELLK